MPNYTDQEVSKRASGGGKDPGRKATADKLYAQATQPPHNDDAQARASLAALSGLAPGVDQDGKATSGWATADARNYGKMLYSQLPGSNYTPEYDKANDGSFKLGKALGTGLRFAAPIAGMAIPGLAPLAGMAIAGLGNAGGQLLSKGNINPLESLAAGAAPGLGRLASGALKGGSALGAGVGNATQSMPGVAGAAGSGGGILGGIGGAVSKLGGLGTIGKVGLGAAKFLGDRAQRKNAEQFSQAQLDLRQKQLGMAEQDYGQRAPLRNVAFERLGAMARGPMGSSVYR